MAHPGSISVNHEALIAINPDDQKYLDALAAEYPWMLGSVIEPDDPNYGVIPSQPSGGISSSPTLGVYMAPDYEARSSAMLGGAAYRYSRRASGILGMPSRTGPVQRVGSNYVSPFGPGLPGPPPPPPDPEDYIPTGPPPVPVIPGESAPYNPYDENQPDRSDDHNAPFRRRRRARSLTR